MSDKRQKNQLMLAFTDESRREAPRVSAEGTETVVAKRGTESLAMGEQLMEEVCARENCKQALARVKANKGSAGVDGMTVNELPGFLKQHWPAIREQLLSGTYKPEPVKRVEIPKPDGGVRKLGIPTVLDRFIQQAVMQVLQRKWDRMFSDHSYGFRPGRSAHQAVAEFDRELERRGLRFARYADDSNIYVRSRRAGERVMESLTRFIMSKLKLQVNQQKSAVARPWARKFLGFSFTSAGTPKRRIAPKAVARFKERIRELTSRNRGVSIERMAEELSRYLRGWIGYFGKCETPSVLAGLEQWLRRRLRSAIWKQWKRGPARFAELRRRAVNADLAAQTAGSDHGPWRLADSPALSIALPNAFFDSLGIPRLTVKPIA